MRAAMGAPMTNGSGSSGINFCANANDTAKNPNNNTVAAYSARRSKDTLLVMTGIGKYNAEKLREAPNIMQYNFMSLGQTHAVKTISPIIAGSNRWPKV